MASLLHVCKAIRVAAVGRIASLWLICALGFTLGTHGATAQEAQRPQKVVVDADGTVEMPAESVPPSSFLSPEAKAYVAQHLHDMQDPEMVQQDNGVPRFMKPMLARDEQLFATTKADSFTGGVHTFTYLPKLGVSGRNQHRVLIDLHGGGFSGCWPGCAVLESMPLAALMKIKVVSVDYREGPEHTFPAASEDVAKVYRELLKTYSPGSIGIYGCSAGGMLTAQSVAWFQVHNLPRPGAVGIFCASAGAFGGDANYIASPLGEARIPASRPVGTSALGYFSTADPKDPLVSPFVSPDVLARFPPTLLITGTRDFAMSGALFTDEQLTKLGVHTELHVWEGLFHGFFYNADVPESMDAFTAMASFFDRTLQ